MDHLHLGTEDEEDMYGGFNEYNATLDVADIAQDEGFLQAVQKTSYGRRQPQLGAAARPPPTAMRMGTAMRGKGALAPGGAGVEARPMTAVRAAGFTSAQQRPGADPRGDRGAAPPLEAKGEESAEDRIKAMEKKVNELIEESCMAGARNERATALEKAKEAGRKERVLVRTREQNNASDQINLDLTYSVLFNLANQYASNDMFQEALNTFQVIVKNKMFSNAGRLKVNMGNIYFRQKQYAKAVKFYRMGLDQVPNSHRAMRIKIMQNVGIAFVKLGQYSDAITSFEHVMQEEPDFKTGLNLLLCYYAMQDKNRMKLAFQKLLSVDLKLDDEDRYLQHTDDKQYELILEVIKNDELRQVEKEQRSQAERCIKMAAKVIAPAIDNSFALGYDWCIDSVKMSAFGDLAHDLEIDKAIMYLKQRDFNQGDESLHRKAIESLKSFERKDTRIASAAATNLSFLYYLEGDLQQADKYAEKALTADRYNPAALVNKGNVLYQQKDIERAHEYFKEALQNDSSCVEALFNLGLCSKRLQRYEEALDSFFKLHTIFKNSAQVIYQIADIYDKMQDTNQAMEWLMQLHGIMGSDPQLLQRLGDLYEAEGDKSQAFSYYYDSFKYYPANLEVIEWLGAYYVESQFSEKAIAYFERAAMMQPNNVRWQLMIASCHRRSGNYQQALETYKSIHRKFPDNVECLQFLVRLCTDMGFKEAGEYANKLKKAEKSREMREQRQLSGTRRSSVVANLKPGGGSLSEGSRENSASSDRQSSAARRHIQDDGTDMFASGGGQVGDVSYHDPLGAAPERPKTGMKRKDAPQADDFGDEELDDTLVRTLR